jgi:hypothetical protein
VDTLRHGGKTDSPVSGSLDVNIMNPTADRNGEDLWAITCYFNPAGYRRRLANYRVFRERLGVPLVAVELAYGPNFELDDTDAEIVVRLRGHDVMWQKERLLNLALRALPSHCTNVVCVDYEIVFATDDWPEHVSRLLRHFVILQSYRRAHHLPRNWAAGDFRPTAAEFSRDSAAYAIASGVAPAPCVSAVADGRYTYAAGFAWAARRELLDRYGLYDACIIGGGDTAMTAAVYGCYDAVMHMHGMNDRQRARYLDWAKPLYEAIGGAAGWMNGTIYHLWHGDMGHRQGSERHGILTRFAFDPFEDIAVDDSGCWRWNSSKTSDACPRERVFRLAQGGWIAR